MSQFPKVESQWNKGFHERPTENSEESNLLTAVLSWNGRRCSPILRNLILARGPSPQIRKLAAFRAKGTKGIPLPFGLPPANRAHGVHCAIISRLFPTFEHNGNIPFTSAQQIPQAPLEVPLHSK